MQVGATRVEGPHDFAAQAHLRIAQNFTGVGQNSDQHGYDLAQAIIAGEHTWLERGIL